MYKLPPPSLLTVYLCVIFQFYMPITYPNFNAILFILFSQLILKQNSYLCTLTHTILFHSLIPYECLKYFLYFRRFLYLDYSRQTYISYYGVISNALTLGPRQFYIIMLKYNIQIICIHKFKTWLITEND